MDVTIAVDGQSHDLTMIATPAKDGWTIESGDQILTAIVERNGSGVMVRIGERVLHVEDARNGQARIDGVAHVYSIERVTGLANKGTAAGSQTLHIRPPMNGKLERLLVAVGQDVAKNDVLFVLEAMKMQNEVRAPRAGRISGIHVAAGATVEPRMIVLDLQPLP